MNSMNDSLSKMKGIEYQLYYEIVVKGVNVTKAVENIADKNNKDTSVIWKKYYKKIKKDVNKISRFFQKVQ